MQLKTVQQFSGEKDASVQTRSQPAPAPTGWKQDGPATNLLRLQRTHGNRFVQRVLTPAPQEAGQGEVTPEVESSIESARGGGQGLDAGVRGQMESAFGADFSGVRIHTGGQSHALNRAVSAVAFTTGKDIFFRDGAYNPAGTDGKKLLAHELTHVVQQGGAQAVPGKAQRVQVQRLCPACEEEKNKEIHCKLEVGACDDQYEHEADRVAERVAGALAGDSARGEKPGGRHAAAGASAEAASKGASPCQRSSDGALGGAIIGGLIGAALGGPAGALVGAVGGALIGGMAGGSKGKGTWSIAQTNTDGTPYSSDVNLTFTPDKDAVNCSEIAFVQSLKFMDATSKTSVETIPNYVNRRTAAGWTLDRVEQRSYGWYGYNNDGKPSGTVSPGSSPSPLKPATMHDRPSDSKSNTIMQFETCAICKSGTDANTVCGCYTWGFSVDAANHLTSLPNQAAAAPSPEFAESVKQWNVQAAGPAANRNDPAQQTLGPFK